MTENNNTALNWWNGLPDWYRAHLAKETYPTARTLTTEEIERIYTIKTGKLCNN